MEHLHYVIRHTNHECNDQTKIVEVQLSFQTHGSFEGEKNHKGGEGLNCVFKNFSFLRSEKLFPDSESEIVQSLT